MMINLKFLGRGSAFNLKEGNTSAYIKNGDTMLLIDCGETVFRKIQRRNLLEDVKKLIVLITHLHSDHVGSLSSLLMYCKYVKNIIPIVAYPNEELLKEFLVLQGNIDGETYKYYKPILLGSTYKKVLNNLGIKVIMDEKTSHDEITESKKIYHQGQIKDIVIKELFSCYRYILHTTEGKKIYYSGDSNELTLYDIDNYNIIYQDVCLADYKGNVHLSLRRLCNIVPKEDRNKVWCMHIDNEQLIDKVKQEGFNVVEVEVI